jgi:hypothetical protein
MKRLHIFYTIQAILFLAPFFAYGVKNIGSVFMISFAFATPLTVINLIVFGRKKQSPAMYSFEFLLLIPCVFFAIMFLALNFGGGVLLPMW